jgi:hypothetical protein
MSTSLLLPNPCLLGIVFTIATHDGNHLVFHYPPKPNEFGFQATPLDINDVGSDVDGMNNSSDSEIYDNEDSDHYGDGGNGNGVDEDAIESDSDEGSSSSSSDDDGDSDGDSEVLSNATDDFDDSDMDSAGMRSQRSSSLETVSDLRNHQQQHGNGHGHHRRTSSSSNKYQSGRDLLEMLYEMEHTKKKKQRAKLRKKRIAKARAKARAEAKTQDKKDSDKRSIKSSITASSGGKLVENDRGKTEHRVEKLFTFEANFISDLATPPKQLCNTRFELTVEDMVFLGLPIHINEDGSWRISKKVQRARSKSVSTSQRSRKQSTVDIERHSSQGEREREQGKEHGGLTPLSPIAHNEDSVDHVEHAEHEDLVVKEYQGTEESRDDCGDDKETNDEEKGGDDGSGGMYQFHLMFVMNPPVVEYNHRIDEMFHYIISRISLLLRYEQQKTNYVWEESQKILQLREELIHLPVRKQWRKIIEESSLAKLISETYNRVINSEIVNIEINGKVNSFQIPIRKEFDVLPPSYVDLPECSMLSSISPFNQLNHFESPTSLSMKNDVMAHYGLILLDDAEVIIRDIKAEKDSVIASFIRMIKPHESLQRLSILSGIDLQEVKMFANHLVYWRRAMAILPLTSRGVYVISPIAPMKNIHKDSREFNKDFPSLPRLSTFLGMISEISSSKPKTISNIIPTRDHRDLYMVAIAWLFKHGYLTQLFTFAYLKICKEIKIKVAEEIEIEMKKREEIKRKRKLAAESAQVQEEEDIEVGAGVTGTGTNEDGDDAEDADDVQVSELNSSARDDDFDYEASTTEDGIERKGKGQGDENGSDYHDADANSDGEEEGGTEGNAETDVEIGVDATVTTSANADTTAEVETETDSDDSGNHERREMDTDARNTDPSEETKEEGHHHHRADDVHGRGHGHGNGHSPSPSPSYSHSDASMRVQFVEAEDDEEDTLLVEPELGSTVERRWVRAVAEQAQSRLGGDGDTEIAEADVDVAAVLGRVARHLNGRTPVELFLAQERVTRREWRRLSEVLTAAGALVVVRHW